MTPDETRNRVLAERIDEPWGWWSQKADGLPTEDIANPLHEPQFTTRLLGWYFRQRYLISPQCLDKLVKAYRILVFHRDAEAYGLAVRDAVYEATKEG